MPSRTGPDQTGGSLLNLVAELELRLGGSPPSPRLHEDLRGVLPEAASYVLVLFDGLGTHQLDHPRAVELRRSRRGDLDAAFPTTTTTNLATVATGLPPSRHGLLGYQLWLPEVGTVVNTIKWTTLWGDPIDLDPGPFLPAPNLWERLRESGVEPITVQPVGFAGSPLSRALYRGCRFEPVGSVAELVSATVTLAAEPGRLLLTYLPQVDVAAHVYGQRSTRYAAAVGVVAEAWERIARRLPPGAVAVGTADHGHLDFPEDRKYRIPREAHEGRIFSGDGRVMFVKGEGASLTARLPATWVPLADMRHWWGPGPVHPAFSERAPDGVLVADDGVLLLHRFSDTRMRGNHGGLTAAERRVPLLVATG